MILHIIDWPNFVYLLVDPGFLLPLKFLWSTALRSPYRMDASDRHNRQTDVTCLCLFVHLCLRWSLTLTDCNNVHPQVVLSMQPCNECVKLHGCRGKRSFLPKAEFGGGQSCVDSSECHIKEVWQQSVYPKQISVNMSVTMLIVKLNLDLNKLTSLCCSLG